jgi:hypothetical protein
VGGRAGSSVLGDDWSATIESGRECLNEGGGFPRLLLKDTALSLGGVGGELDSLELTLTWEYRRLDDLGTLKFGVAFANSRSGSSLPVGVGVISESRTVAELSVFRLMKRPPVCSELFRREAITLALGRGLGSRGLRLSRLSQDELVSTEFRVKLSVVGEFDGDDVVDVMTVGWPEETYE